MAEKKNLVAESREKRNRDALEFLADRLRNGPALVSALKLDAKRNGVSWASVRLARYELKLRSFNPGEGQTWACEAP